MKLSSTEVKVIERLRGMTPQFESWLEQFVSTDTHTDNHAGINDLGWQLEQEFMKSGLHTSAFVTGVSGQYLIAKTRVREGNRLMLLGHMDTVFPTGSVDLEVTADPENSDRLLGPGVTDMKGGIAIILGAVRALNDEGLLKDRSLCVLFSADEETGSPAGRDLIRQEAEEQHLCLVFESGTPLDGRASAFVTGRKGMGRFKLKIKGIAAHSGVAKAKGLSAALEAAHKIIALEALNNGLKNITVNVGTVSSGTSINTVPDAATLEIDCRFADPVEGEKVLARIREICSDASTCLEEAGTKPELILEELCGHQPFVRTEAIGRMADRIKEWGQDLGLSLEEESRGGCSDGNITAALGIPTVDGLGAVGGRIHSQQEWLDKQSLLDRSSLLALTMMRFYEL